MRVAAARDKNNAYVEVGDNVTYLVEVGDGNVIQGDGFILAIIQAGVGAYIFIVGLTKEGWVEGSIWSDEYNRLVVMTADIERGMND